MKKILFMLVFLLPTLFLQSQETHIYGPVRETTFVTWIKEGSSGTPYDYGACHRVGVLSSGGKIWELRNVNFWEWTYSNIPTEANVTSVTLKFRVYGSKNDFHFLLHNFDKKNTSGVNFFNEFNSTNSIYSETLNMSTNYAYFDRTFTSGPVFDAIKNAIISGSNFLTLGIRLDPNYSMIVPWYTIQGYDGTSENQPVIDLTINYWTQNQYYQFANQIQSNENYGYLILDNDIINPIPSNSNPRLFSWGSQHLVRTAELPFIIDWLGTGTTQKYSYWNFATREYILNYSIKAIPSNPYIYKAKFDQTNPATISTRLLEGGAEEGYVELKDPWYYYKDANNNWYQSNQFMQYTAPFFIANNSSTSYGGVFLNQAPDPQNPNAPYYTVRAPQEQPNINGFKGVFVNWSGDPNAVTYQNANNRETPVVFKQAGATATALYKAHLGSSNAYVTSSKGQRRIAQYGGSNTIVYESQGSIWAVTQTGSSTYGAEQCISIGSGNSSPSLTIYANGILAVWYRFNAGTNYIYAAKYTSGIWQTPFVIDLWQSTLPTNSLPVASYIYQSGLGSARFIIAYNGSYSNVLFTKISTDDCATWQNDIGFYGFNPSLSEVSRTVLAYQSTNGLFFSEYGYNTETILPEAKMTEGKVLSPISYKITAPPVGWWGWGLNEFIPSSGAVPYLGPPVISNQSSSPQIKFDSWRTHICWLQTQTVYVGAYVTFYYAVHQPRNASGGWGTAKAYNIYATTGTPPPLGAPTIGSSQSDGSAIMLWSVNNSIYKAVGDGNNVWSSSPQTIASARFPSIGIGLPYSAQTYLSTETVSNIYRINTNNFSFPKEAVSPTINYARVLTAVDTVTHQTVSVHMTEPKIGGRRLSFVAVNDTMPGITADNFFDYFTTEETSLLTNSDTVMFSLSLTNTMPDDTISCFALTMNGIGEKSKIAPVADLVISKKSKHVSSEIKRAVKNFRGKKFQLKPENSSLSLSGGNWVFTLTHVYLPKTEYAQLSKNQQTDDITLSLPTSCALLPNYPNPFNPTTAISYQLMANSNVSLKIYDMLGREVATLADGMKDAGYYTATFDASHLASGIYFARLTATPQEGKPFVQVRKLMLTK